MVFFFGCNHLNLKLTICSLILCKIMLLCFIKKNTKQLFHYYLIVEKDQLLLYNDFYVLLKQCYRCFHPFGYISLNLTFIFCELSILCKIEFLVTQIVNKIFSLHNSLAVEQVKLLFNNDFLALRKNIMYRLVIV